MVIKISQMVDRLNLELAWKRTEKSIRRTGFFYHPYEFKLINANVSKFTENLKDKISYGYRGTRSKIIDVPKPKYHIRPGYILTLEDTTLYAALILDSLEKIKKNIDWSSQKIRFSNDLLDSRGNIWANQSINGWNQFREESYRLIDEGYEYVLFTDISSFYENILIDRLNSDLKNIKIDDDVITLLTQLLYAWAHPKFIGIPQGFKMSDILSEVYMDSIDKRLYKEGVVHLRFSDDMRIFCKSHDEAVNSLHLLTKLYREKGLNLQSSKSLILHSDFAKAEMNGHTKIINQINEEISEMDFHELFDLSVDPSELYEDFEEKLEELDPEFLKHIFNEYLDGKSFDKTVFHYVINRLGLIGDEIATDYCIEKILEEPQETKFILGNYFSHLDNKVMIGNELMYLMKEGSYQLEYQKYLILRWLWENDIYSEDIFKIIYDIFKDKNTHRMNFDYCMAYIGKYGDYDDYDIIYSHCDGEENELSLATMIISIKNMEKSRRNSIYSLYENKSDLLNQAINYVKGL